jgi:DNA-damage-inducible protein J
VSKNTTLNLRVDSEIKERTGKILASMGLTFSEAFNLMLHQVDIQRALPFDVVAYSHTPKPETLALIERIENGEEEIVGPFSSKEELWSSLEL